MPNVKILSNNPTGDTWTPLRRADGESSARTLLLTILGEFVLPGGGAAWTGTLLHALRQLDVEEAAARQALARSSARGLIRAERVGRRTRWLITERATRILTEGAERIYGFGSTTTAWDTRWLLILTTVPEQNRHLRAQLRTRMTWSGFGALAPGTWVSPWAEREVDARTILTDLGLREGSLSWVGHPGTLGGVLDKIGEIWDLSSVAAEYRDFTKVTSSEQPGTPEEVFTALVRLVHRWRHFPGRDPGLPADLLPPTWPAPEAAALFRARRAEWSPVAWSYYRSIAAD